MSKLKFKGVVTGKKEKYGEVIEYSTEEKIPIAVQLALSEYAPYKDKYLSTATSVGVAKCTESPIGEKLKGKWENNLYDVTGKVTIAKRHLRKDCMMKPETKSFHLKFGDCLSHNGLPEFKIVLFEMSI